MTITTQETYEAKVRCDMCSAEQELRRPRDGGGEFVYQLGDLGWGETWEGARRTGNCCPACLAEHGTDCDKEADKAVLLMGQIPMAVRFG